MADVRERLDPDGGLPMMIHWSPAEVSTLETAYNSAVERHPEKAWASRLMRGRPGLRPRLRQVQ